MIYTEHLCSQLTDDETELRRKDTRLVIFTTGFRSLFGEDQLPTTADEENTTLRSLGPGPKSFLVGPGQTLEKAIEVGSDFLVVGPEHVAAGYPAAEVGAYREKGWEAYRRRIGELESEDAEMQQVVENAETQQVAKDAEVQQAVKDIGWKNRIGCYLKACLSRVRDVWNKRS